MQLRDKLTLTLLRESRDEEWKRFRSEKRIKAKKNVTVEIEIKDNKRSKTVEREIKDSKKSNTVDGHEGLL